MWILYAFAGSLVKSLASVYRKPLSNLIDPFIAVFLQQIFYAVVFGVAVFISGQFSQVLTAFREHFLLSMVVSVMGVGAQFALIKASKIGQISKITSLFSLISIVNLIVSYIVLGEVPTLLGFAGVFLIVFGVYVVNLPEKLVHWYQPFVDLFRSKYFWWVLMVIICWGTIPTFDRSVVSHTNPILWGFVVSMNMLFISVLSIIPKLNQLRQVNFSSLKYSALAGTSEGLGYVFGLLALSQAFVVYSQSIRRFDILFSAYFSHKILKEKVGTSHLFGVLTMIVGAVLIALA